MFRTFRPHLLTLSRLRCCMQGSKRVRSLVSLQARRSRNKNIVTSEEHEAVTWNFLQGLGAVHVTYS